MATFSYQASWGGIRMWCSTIRTEGGRDLVIHERSSGTVRDVQDRGGALKRVSCSLLFDEIPAETMSPLDRFNRFRQLVDGGDSAIFTHPIEGSFLARIGRFEATIQDNTYTAEAEFVAVEETAAVVLVSGTLSQLADFGDVGAAADGLDTELADVGLATTVTSSARSASDAWASDAKSARDILVDVNNLSTQIADEIDAFKLETDVELWPALKAYVLLDSAIRDGAAAAMGTSPQYFSLRLFEPTSLRSLMAQIYGGSDADDRYSQALDLNDIRTPARIPAGTSLKLPAPPATARSS